MTRRKWDVSDERNAEDEKKVGEYIKAHTKPDDRVFALGYRVYLRKPN